MEGNFCCGLIGKLKQTSKWRKLKQNILNRYKELIQKQNLRHKSKLKEYLKFFRGEKKNLEHTPCEFFNSSPMIIGPLVPNPQSRITDCHVPLNGVFFSRT